MVWHARFRGEDLYHHIYAWGNDHHPIFKERCHYQRYLNYLEEYSTKHKVDIIAYALMRGHVHLFVYDRENNISEFMLHLHGEYAKFYNWSAHRVGHVFGERYNNKIIEANEYGMWLTRYIHRQALKAGIVGDPQHYPWTSYRMYIGEEKNIFLKHEIIIKQFGTGDEAYQKYRDFVLGDNDGPIDWSLIERDQSRSRIGIAEACKQLNTNSESMLNPKGWRERRSRHKLINLLIKEQGYKIVEIARYFKMSKGTVSRIIK
jgi:REP element-mobilizing transposase RayT